MRNVLMIVSGPSGVGKGTLVKRLIKEREDVTECVTCTTRAPRAGEVHGREYFFLSKEEFERRIQEDGFLEYDKHFDNYYGTPKAFVEETLKSKSVVLEIDVVGALNAKKVYPDSVLVMIAPPSKEVLAARLRGRGTETDEEIARRLSRLNYELSQQDKYDHVLINDDLETAYNNLCNLLDEEKNKQ
ncbi:MAG: guanylate kinase [Clostridia bacterium]|nr:guanylate kinase [Clostridia bacterium]